MKELTQKFLAAGLTAALIPFTLAGCGQKPVPSPETAPNSSASLQSAARSPAPQTVSEAVKIFLISRCPASGKSAGVHSADAKS